MQERIPIGDAVRIANGHRDRQFTRHKRNREQTQAGFVRKPVGLLRVDLLAGEDAVLPRCLASARTRDDVVYVTLVDTQSLAGVLATVAISLPNRTRAKRRPLLRYAGVVDTHNYCRHTD